MEKKYNALRMIGTIFKILGGLTGILAILLVLTTCAASVLGGAAIDSISQDYGGDYGFGVFGGIVGGLFLSLAILLSVGVSALTLYGFGELIFLSIAVEENTRATALLSEKQIRQMDTPGQ